MQTAYTTSPCYAPRSPLVDEATLYYWQVVPVRDYANSSTYSTLGGASGGFTAPPSFQHASVPPTPISPIGGASASGPVVFHWSGVPEQVRNYTIEVAQDDSFSTDPRVGGPPTPRPTRRKTTYPVGATVYWRVRANNDDSKGLAWSATSTLRADAARADDHDRRAVHG